jgi:hypothetical protein
MSKVTITAGYDQFLEEEEEEGEKKRSRNTYQLLLLA